MRSLHLLPHTEAIDGIQRATLDFSRGLAEAGEPPIVLSLDRGNNIAAWEEVADVGAPAPFLRCSPRTPLAAARTWRLAHGLSGDFDVVVAHRIDLLNAGAIISLSNSTPLVLHAHNAPPPWLRWKDAVRVPGARRVNRVLVASRFMKQTWAPVVGSLPIAVVEYPVDLEHFALPPPRLRAEARAEAGAEPGQFVVAFVGRLEEAKGPHVLLAAARRLHESGQNVRVLVQGAPNLGVGAVEADAFRQTCVASAGDCPVTWVPPGPDVRGTIHAADVCAVPSIWPEPSGLTVAEALATGTPLVASDVGGIPEQLPDSPQARLVPPADPEALADALEALRECPPIEAERQGLRDYIEDWRLLPDVAARYHAELIASTGSYS